VALLEHAVREDLNLRAPRVSAVLDPIRLVLTNYPEGKTEMMDAVNNPEDPASGTHPIAFTRELFIEREDFMEDAPKKFFRLTPGQEVRLKNAYIVKCTGCRKDNDGRVETVYAEYDPTTLSGSPASARKVKGTLHWVSVERSLPAEVRLYDRLFRVENPAEEKDRDFRELLNPNSLKVLTNCRVEEQLTKAKPLDNFQFQRLGYFNLDPDSRPNGKLIFNRTVPLKDTWSKLKDKQ